MKVKKERRFDRAKDAKWRGIMSEFGKSSLSVRKFCRRHGISEPSFYSWRRTLAERDRKSASDVRPDANGQLNLRGRGHSWQEQATLASVSVVNASAQCIDWVPAVEINFGRNLQVRIDGCCPATLLESVLSMLSVSTNENGEPTC